MVKFMASLKLSKTTVKKSLSAHRNVALATAGLLYLTCLTGALTVFFEEFQRWEQPNIEEYTDYTPAQIDTAIEEFQQRVNSTPETLWVVLPTEAVPRMHISGDGQEWFINKDGSLSAPPLEVWTTMLTKLHVQLHLPENIGLILVGILGVLLFSLILSGLLSHPNIFKDAFRWRRGRQVLTQVDLHNRLSIWALPFYLMISFTGAFIGLLGLYSFFISAAFYDNDTEALLHDVYGGDPEISEVSGNLNIDAALQTLSSIAPQADPIYLAIQNINTDKQYLEIAATLPQRLIYSEIYRFNADGSFINHQQFSDGAVGQQIAYSVYRLHFGHYAGQWVKIIYGILGLALSVICASGINIWLARRKHESSLNDLWVATVWGLPLSLSISALLSFYSWVPLWVFLGVELIVVVFALLMKQALKTRWLLRACLAVTLLIIVVRQEAVYLNEIVTPMFHQVNLTLLGASLILIMMLFQQRDQCRT